MSDYTGPGLYEILPKYAQNMSLNIWGGSKSAGTPIKLYPRTSEAQNTHFEIVAAGGTQGRAEEGDREYHIIAGNSGLYVASNDNSSVTVELRAPCDASIRWKIACAGNGAFYINNVGDNKQLNVRGGSKDTGTELITYAKSKGENAQFILRALDR